MPAATGNTLSKKPVSASHFGETDLMNRDNSDLRTPFRDRTAKARVAPLRQKAGMDSSLCDLDYFPTPGERRLLAWLSHVAGLPGKATVRMALLLLRSAIACRRKQHPMIIPKSVAKAGMSRVAAYEGLRALETAGLVTVKRCRGRSPLVTIVDENA